jgi:RNA polymerase sigma-70 factor (ECF subfamily)
LKKSEDIDHETFIANLQRGNKLAFEKLYDNYSPAIYGVILRMLRKEDLAADTMQEAFIKIWKNISKYEKSKGALYTWMLNIARNTAIDKIRKIKREGQVEIQTFDSFVSNSDKHQTTMNVDHLGVKEVVDGLEEDQKIIIDYLYFGGYTQQEVSDELGIPLGTVKTRARTALKKLRKTLVNFIFWI